MRSGFNEDLEIDGNRFRLSLAPARPETALAGEWQALSAACGASVFLSWPWISAFLAGLPEDFEPFALKVHAGDRLVALALPISRAGEEPHGRWVLNESGDAALDSATLEYNRLLIDPTAPPGLAAAVLERLMGSSFAARSLRFGGLAGEALAATRNAAGRAGWLVRPLQIQETFWLDLAPFEGRSEQFAFGLSRNTRTALQRAQRLYEDEGALQWETAQTPAEALHFLAELEGLHTAQWQARGQSGAFAQPAFRAFHERLIAAGFDRGIIRLHRLRRNDRTFASLYNLAWNGTVYAYQSGFAFDADNRRKPGYVAHGFAIRQAIAEGARRYDFCAGATQLKQSLASHREPMVWLEMNPPTALNRLIAWLRGAKKSLRSVAAA